MTENFGFIAYHLHAPIPKAITFAFVSDLHGVPNQPVLHAVDALAPDALLVGGDFLHSASNYRRGFAFLRQAARKYPTFVSIGNHERMFRGDLFAELVRTGAVILDNRAVVFEAVLLGGLSSGFQKGDKQGIMKRTPKPNLQFLSDFSRREGYKILLSHHPEYYPRYIRGSAVDLTLSGHAHGGQWRFFGRGLFAPGQGIFPKYTDGIYENRLIVGRGFGELPLIPRIHNTPAVIALHLHPQQ